MGTNISGEHGKKLVIVESPTKAGTIKKVLGDDFVVEASVGHVRDLVTKKSDLTPKDKRRQEPWIKYGVNVENGFSPLEEIYRVPATKKRQIEDLRAVVEEVDSLYLATDDDREGEAISWHLLQELKPKVPVQRLVFREITPRAIRTALETPREIDMDLVTAQRTRRIIDRLYGWDVSQLLWRKIKPGLSAGRVQSVALRLLVQRERERIQHQSSEYWDIRCYWSGSERERVFQAQLTHVDGKRIAAAKDFDKVTGALVSKDVLVLAEQRANELVASLMGKTPRVVGKDVRPLTQRPQAPYTTSTLQQAAHGKLRFSAQRTMRVAQSLYEKGLITYMRTDSVRLSDEAVALVRSTIEGRLGKDFVSPEVRTFKSKSKNLQDAHEAIRPSGHDFASVDQLSVSLTDDERKLYDLIWRRAVASQMADAKLEQTTIQVELDNCKFRAGGRVVKFAGYLALADAADDGEGSLLPDVDEGHVLQWSTEKPIEGMQHATKPPNRLNDASLVKTLEEYGIGRPSTYASIIQSIIERDYVFRRSNALIPTFMGMAVVRMLESHTPHLVDFDFTAHMEERLDEIARGEADYASYLQRFYHDGFSELQGVETVRGLRGLLEEIRDSIDPATASSSSVGVESGEEVLVKIGRYGTFIKHGERTASVPDDLAPDELSLAVALDLLRAKELSDLPIGTTEAGDEIFVRKGRFGEYIQVGEKDTDVYQTVSLSKGMKSDSVDEALARRQLSLPKELGAFPANKEPIFAHVGRYGDYVRCGKETRNLDGKWAIDVTHEEAVALLEKPKVRGKTMLSQVGVRASDGASLELWRGRYGVYVTDGTYNKTLGDIDEASITVELATQLLEEAKVAKDGVLLGVDEASKREVRLMQGRFGAYITDGEMNASLPKGTEVDSVDLRYAIERIHGYGKPVKKKAPSKKKATTTGKAAAKKKSSKKKA